MLTRNWYSPAEDRSIVKTDVLWNEADAVFIGPNLLYVMFNALSTSDDVSGDVAHPSVGTVDWKSSGRIS